MALSPLFSKPFFWSYAARNFPQSLASATVSPENSHSFELGRRSESRSGTLFARTAATRAEAASSGVAKTFCLAACARLG
jgi:hypothetical protein